MSKLGSPSHSPFSWGYLGGSKKLGRVIASTVYMNYRSLGGFRNANFMLNSELLRLFCYPFKSAHGDCPILDTGELRLAMRTADPCTAPVGTFCSRFMS